MQIYSDEQIIDLIKTYMEGSQNPDFLGYREQTRQRDFRRAKNFLWSIKTIAHLGRYRNKRILDVGCGFGWHAFTISLLDDQNEVIGLDIQPSMIDGMNDCIRSMQQKQITFNLKAMNGDICNLDLGCSSLDAIYSNEAIEHVHHMEAMVERCSYLLRPGGSIILINDQNLLNEKTRSETIAMWQKREHSWEWSDYLRSIRPIEHGQAKPFAVRREEIVRAANPSLDDKDVADIVAASAGKLTTDIEALARSYTAGMSLPVPPALDWCRNPDTGEYAERLFDPFWLASVMKKHGFRTQVRHLFRKVPQRFANGIQFRPINRLLFKKRAQFVVYGIKG